ncbi:MAG: SprT-like domain-containing protein [Gammaproteobacteria bacterium]|nr:SprT-like domain-containing protein [Gammaproteobacteria bacterium]
MKNEPTKEVYSELLQAYTFFNKELFENCLPECLITLQRQKRTYGYFAPSRFTSKSGDEADEIALNPTYFATRNVPEVLSTLVHEMCHLWQRHFGMPGRGRYHNREWAEKMKSIGLCPSHTGEIGGKETGDQLTHYIVENGLFVRVYEKLISSGYAISWVDKAQPIKEKTISPKSGKRTKFSCPKCKTNIWGMASVRVICGKCLVPYEKVLIPEV